MRMFIKVRGKELWKLNPECERAHRPPDFTPPKKPKAKPAKAGKRRRKPKEECRPV